MERPFQVYDATAELDGEELAATYYIEYDFIHVMIEDEVFVLRLSDEPASDAVQALLLDVLTSKKPL